ncbi:unnamed protein product [Microthlaspi erraticum]|uniref:Retroviral polymerase SH3-like domain-containing protein n=1 Tax=Microthlaspi erraticum TaxID=1685480 RepID=A0A6D2KTH8_9BRAS|nr:unnamed protein product [Microthlaspi erraticum]
MMSPNCGIVKATETLKNVGDLDIEQKLKLINKPAVKIIKSIYGERYGCVDFYKQPGFDHSSMTTNHTSFNYKFAVVRTSGKLKSYNGAYMTVKICTPPVQRNQRSSARMMIQFGNEFIQAAATAPVTDRSLSLTQIKTHIPLILDMNHMNYDIWRELFETHCHSFSVLGHIDGTSLPTGDEDTVWAQTDGTVKMWIYGTISESLLKSVLKTKCSAAELWKSLENLFRDNKESRAIQLENELRQLRIGDLPVHEYCQKLKTLSDLLANVDSPITDRQLVMHLLNGLSSKFDNIINVIRHRSPACTFSLARSMLKDEEDRLNTKRQIEASHNDTASSPQILVATAPPAYDPNPRSNSGDHQNRGNRNNRGNRGGRNSKGRGNSNWQGNWNSGPPSPWVWPNTPPWPMLAPWQQQPPWPIHWSGPPTPGPSPWSNYPRPPATQPPSSGLLGQTPRSTYLSTHNTPAPPSPAPQNEMIPTALATAFNTMSLSDPTDAGWYMDTGATAHLTAQPGKISSLSSSASLPLVTVGNGALIPATADLRTRVPLIRCDSSGPLYAITSPSRNSSHHALVTSTASSIWHRRLGHPGDSVLRLLSSSGFPSKHRGFRCVDLETRRIIISRHVVFDENVFPFAGTSPPSPPFPVSPMAYPPPLLQVVSTAPLTPPADPPSPPPPLSPPLSPTPVPPSPVDPNPPTPPLSPGHNSPPPSPQQQLHPAPIQPAAAPVPTRIQTRSQSGIVKPKKLFSLHTATISPLPRSHLAAFRDPNWNPAMHEEYNSQMAARSWTLVPRPLNTNIVRSMWLYTHKFRADGSLARHKARLVANGKSQQAGVDCA